MVSSIALILAESIRKTDDLARAHGAQLLELSELAFVARIIGTARLERELAVGDFEELQRLSARALESDFVSFDIERLSGLRGLLAEADSAIEAESPTETTPASSRDTTSPLPEPMLGLPPVRHRTRPIPPRDDPPDSNAR